MTLYLDNAATTKINNEVVEAMVNSLEHYGNSEAKYYCFAEDANDDIKKARKQVAEVINCKPEDVIFTSGATESNNLIIKGLALSSDKRKIIISAIEHSSINVPCEFLKKFGYTIVKIPVDDKGKIDLEVLDREINDDTLLVSIIFVNNEIGTIQDLKRIDDICLKHDVFFHSDFTQAIGKIAINLQDYSSLRAITFTAHKIYGPKGIGALVVKKDKNGLKQDIVPLIHGGEQENGFRAGTLANELIVGFGKACELITKDILNDNKLLCQLETVLINKLREKFKELFVLNNNWSDRIPGLINIQIKGFNNAILLKEIAPKVAASTGSACSVSKPSSVLKAIGLSEVEIGQSIRLSLSKYTSIDELSIIEEL